MQKRYTATAEFLEILVTATVDPDDPLEFPEFLVRLKDDFGIEILVTATVDPDDPLEFPEFLVRLKDDFGIVLGRPQDARSFVVTICLPNSSARQHPSTKKICDVMFRRCATSS